MDKTHPVLLAPHESASLLAEFLFNGGKSMEEVAKQTGYALSTVYTLHTKWKQKNGDQRCYHHAEKQKQIREVLGPVGRTNLKIYEVFGGELGCTEAYVHYGVVTQRFKSDGDCLAVTRRELLKGRKYDVLDIDGFGYPHPLLYAGALELLEDEGYLFLTMPKPGCCRGNKHTRARNAIAYHALSPQPQHVEIAVTEHACRRLMKTERIGQVLSLGQVWRFAFKLTRVNANELFGSDGYYALPDLVDNTPKLRIKEA